MNVVSMHVPASADRWRGRCDPEEGAAGRRWHEVVRSRVSGHRGTALVGFACDAGVRRNQGRVGAREGPEALRRALANLPVRSGEPIIDAGDIVCRDDALEAAQAELAGVVTELLGRGLFPCILGGGHEVAYASFSGLAGHLAQRPGKPRIGIVNLDAHLDLRLAQQPNSGTPFLQIANDCRERGWDFRYCCLGASEFANTAALFDRARELGAQWLRDEELVAGRLDAALGVLEQFVRDVEHVYLTLCLDVLPASVAPGVSAPAARGVALEVVEALIDRVLASGKLRLADIAELNPHFDVDGQTARVGARLAARICDGVAMARHGEETRP